MTDKTADLILELERRNWTEPTKKEFLSYWQAFETDKKPDFYYEDIHFVWENYRPELVNN